MEYRLALIVGRFQPFHKGHLFLIKKALEKAEKIVIAIGSANIIDENNPIDFETRKKIIKAVAYKEKIVDRLIKIVPLDDFFDDKKWLENLKRQIGEFDVALGNNDWTNKVLKRGRYKVIKVEHYKRNLYEGWKIRKLIKEGKKWQDRVPNYIVKWLNGYMVKNNNLTMKQFNNVVLGGTFDRFHAGHKALIIKAFDVGKKVTIGIGTEKLYKNKFLSESIEPFSVRKKFVSDFLKKKNWLKRAKLISFSDFTGGVDKMGNANAIVVSKETFPNALKINQLREKNKLKTLKIVVIDDVLSDDGKLISSERIRAGEINREGKIYKIQNQKSKTQEIIMPESLRPTLQKPLGRVFKNQKSLLQYIDTSKHTLIIAVGDIIVEALIKNKINPDVKIIDFRSRRQAIKNPKSKIQMTNQIQNPNKPGTINLKTAEIINKKIKRALYKKQKSWIVIEGEEDLLALPAILFAPLNSLVLYGHWQFGILAVLITEKNKLGTIKLLNKFN